MLKGATEPKSSMLEDKTFSTERQQPFPSIQKQLLMNIVSLLSVCIIEKIISVSPIYHETHNSQSLEKFNDDRSDAVQRQNRCHFTKWEALLMMMKMMEVEKNLDPSNESVLLMHRFRELHCWALLVKKASDLALGRRTISTASPSFGL